MSDSVVLLDPKRVFFVQKRDREWKSVTPNSFVSSTADDLADDDPFLQFEPEKLSIRNLVRGWQQEKTLGEHVKCCDLCESSLSHMRKSLKLKPKQPKIASASATTN